MMSTNNVYFTILALGVASTDARLLGKRSVDGDLRDLYEMVPFDYLASLFMEYMGGDAQVNRVMRYVTGEELKSNLAQLQMSEEFRATADYLSPTGMDLYRCFSKINNMLDISHARRLTNRRRSPGDGLLGFLKDALAIIPLDDMKQQYQEKVATNPEFKVVMDRLLTAQLRNHLYSLMSTNDFEEMANELIGIGVPVGEIIDFVEREVVMFFDLEDDELA